MPAVHVWILAVALSAAGVGVLGGRLWAKQAAAAAVSDVYAEQLIASYSLDREQARSLRVVLAADREAEDAIRRDLEWQELPPTLQGRLLAARAMTRERIRALLDEGQRQRYDRDSQPAAPEPAPTQRR
jgi:hypothetical protein